ncbi:hypothetical protein SD235_33175 (plasmid) [Burkholderia cepacia]|uniref:hypothetical protein n=1 Tax=Burkholderia cepacia TaxID=292 RepID=UPI003A4E317B
MTAAQSDNASSDFMPADLRQSVVTQTLPHSQVSISRLKTSRRDIGRTAPYELEDADLVVLQLRAFGEQELWLDGRVARFVPYQAGTVTIHDLDRRWVSDLKGTFDCIHFHLPRRTLEETVDEIGGRQRPQLYLPPHLSKVDPIIHRLGQALLWRSPGMRPGSSSTTSRSPFRHMSRASTAASASGGRSRRASSRRGRNEWRKGFFSST